MPFTKEEGSLHGTLHNDDLFAKSAKFSLPNINSEVLIK